MKPLLVTSGEPAGIGPDVCLALAGHPVPLVVLGDLTLLEARARQLNQSVRLRVYQDGVLPIPRENELTVWPISCQEPVVAGELNVANAAYVLALLTAGVKGCLEGAFSALVTAPVHKGIINQAGFNFTGHTEFFAQYCHRTTGNVNTVVMMLVCDQMRVALVTTHMPLRAVADAITPMLLTNVLSVLDQGLRTFFEINAPRIFVAGLNPHAGEGGYLGLEEQEIIIPVLSCLANQGMDVRGPFPADTLFTAHQIMQCDAFVAMYHDQGLPVLKHVGFGDAVNVTLGLPIIRTSVDHGTALNLAATGHASAGSLTSAVNLAAKMVGACS